MIVRAALFSVAGLLAPGLPVPLAAAAGSNDADCRLANLPLASRSDVAAARVTAAGRTHFVRDGTEAKSCPNDSPGCRKDTFLVTGDRVMLGATRGAFVCASHLDAAGDEPSGWLPSAAVARESERPVAPRDWIGTWTQTDATITLTAGANGTLIVKGNATYGAHDPGRVARGAVHVGEIDARFAPEGSLLSFAVGEVATLPVAEGDEADCKVWMRLLGGRLLVEDNARCGGASVSFGGTYVRVR